MGSIQTKPKSTASKIIHRHSSNLQFCGRFSFQLPVSHIRKIYRKNIRTCAPHQQICSSVFPLHELKWMMEQMHRDSAAAIVCMASMYVLNMYINVIKDAMNHMKRLNWLYINMQRKRNGNWRVDGENEGEKEIYIQIVCNNTQQGGTIVWLEHYNVLILSVLNA